MQLADTVDFYYLYGKAGETKVNASPITLTELDGTAVFTYNTADKKIPIGKDIEITAEYGGSGNLNSNTETINITLNKKMLTATVTAGTTKVYDGEALFTNVALTLSNSEILSGDSVTATADGNATKNNTADANVEASKPFVAKSVSELQGTNISYYSLDKTAISGTVEITAKDMTATGQNETRTIVKGVGNFSAPVFDGVSGEMVTGTVTAYDYSGKTTYDDVVTELAKLSKGETATVGFTFAANGNYTGTITGTLNMTVVDLQFAGQDSALIVKPTPIYGDKWNAILQYDTSKLSATLDGTSVPGSFTLTVNNTDFADDTIPKAGTFQYKVTFTATSDNRFQNIEVLSGSVTVAQREAALSWSNTELTYNSVAQMPAATIANKISGDDVEVTVTGSQTNVGSRYTATAGVLTGTDIANYKLPAVTTTTFSIQAAAPAGSVVISTADDNSNEKLDTGDTVTADISGITPIGGTLSYQWKKIADSAISNIGSGQATYTLTASDVKGKIFCEVTFSGNVVGTKESNELDIAKILLKGTITITGDTTLGSTLAVTTPTNATPADYTVKWLRDDVEIQGASATSYILTKFDLGKTIKVVITAKEESEAFTGTLTSNNVPIPATVPEKPTITAVAGNGLVTVNDIAAFDNGSAITGYTLTVKQGDTPIIGSPFTLSLSTTSYKVENLTNKKEYSFMLTASNAMGSTDSDVIKATPTGSSSGGESTGGSGGNSSPGGGTNTQPADNDQGNVTPPSNEDAKVPAKVDKNGKATAIIKEQNIADAIKKARNAADKNGVAVNIKLESKKSISSFKVTLPKAIQKQLVEAKARTIMISSGNLSITFDMAALDHIYNTTNADVTVTATKIANRTLSKEAKRATGGRPVYDFKVTVRGKSITTFGKGNLSISIPYPLKKIDRKGNPNISGSLENPSNLVGVYIHANGKLTYLPGSSYNAARQTMLINTNHLSIYGMVYKTNASAFTDITTHWAKDDIQFVAARSLLMGTTATTFSPDLSMTRGMFVTALGRLAEIDPNSYKTSSFIDVAADSSYLPYVEWAVKNNIVTGTSATTFAPDQSITRQEMAVITANYAKAMGCKLPSIHKEITFTDSANIDPWAKSAVKEMQMAGVIMGKDGGKFDPTGTATRAEGSVILRRFIELMANSVTAEGWT